MRLGLTLGYWGPGSSTATTPADGVALARTADQLGYSVAWAAEAYGSDSPTVLAYVAAHTERIDVGSAVMQIPARTPACTAMTAATLDALSGGRFRLGLGVSGPQVSEGWHGVRFDDPLGRTREYVEIVRQVLRRERLTYAGEHWTLPLPRGPGKALTLTIRPVREHLPIYLAALGPRNLELTGEIADGWLAMFLGPEHAKESLDRIRVGRGRAGRSAGQDGLDGFDVVASVPVVLGADIEAAAAPVRAHAALYLGGMGSRDRNVYAAAAARMGFGDAAERVQDLFLDRRHRDAAAAVPHEFVDATSLVGPPARIAERLPEYAEAGVTTLSVACLAGSLEERVATLRTMAELFDATGLRD